LKESYQQQMFDYLQKLGITNFIGVPDSTLKDFIKRGLEKKKILITSREEEAIGIAAGMLLAKSPSLVFMQNAGFANSLSSITSLIQLYKFPLIFLIGWRGYLKNDAPEHEKIGKIQLDLLKTMNLDYKIVQNKNWKKMCEWSLKKSENNDSCALVIPREFLD
jgi:sulfopyruvate decarboxylase TPP-binding subunit